MWGNRSGPFLSVLILAVTAATLASCRNETPEPAAVTTSTFGGTDIAWIETTIALDESVLPLLDLAPTHTGNANVRALSLQVQALTEAELSTLQQLYQAAGLPAQNPHSGLAVPGTVTDDELAATMALNGKKFDTAVTKQITEFLESTRELAESESKSGVEAQSQALALNVVRTRTAALASLGS